MREIELKIPDIGDNDAIELLQWNLKEGESFSEGDELCDLVTDKAAFSLEAPQKGTLSKIIEPNKSEVKIGQLVAIAHI